jgi:branched-chain amino acid aminotransferase
MTPPQTGSILSGLTRQWVAQKAQDMGISVIERRLTRPDVFTADEMFLTGTYMEIMPVTVVDGRVIGDGEPGKITRTLKHEFIKVTRGV